MYRQYEDPRTLERALAEARIALRNAEAMDDLDHLVSCHDTVAELEERVNFARQDIEYEESFEYDEA